MFRLAAEAFNGASDRWVEAKGPASWPGDLRVKAVVNVPGIFEMTWRFTGPDGRATWEWATVMDRDGRLTACGALATARLPGRLPGALRPPDLLIGRKECTDLQ